MGGSPDARGGVSHREANSAVNRGYVPYRAPRRAGGQGSAGERSDVSLPRKDGKHRVRVGLCPRFVDLFAKWGSQGFQNKRPQLAAVARVRYK